MDSYNDIFHVDAEPNFGTSTNFSDYCPTEEQQVVISKGGCQWPPVPYFDWDSCVFVSKYIPSLLALIINVGLLPVLIDLIAMFGEVHFLYTDMYRSILRKNLGLLLVTTLLIPSLALNSSTQFWDVIWDEWYQVSALISTKSDSLCPALECTAGHVFERTIHQNSEMLYAVSEILKKPFQILTRGFGAKFVEEAGGFFYRYLLASIGLY